MKKLIIRDQNKNEIFNLGKQRSQFLKEQFKENKQLLKVIIDQYKQEENKDNLKFLYW